MMFRSKVISRREFIKQSSMGYIALHGALTLGCSSPDNYGSTANKLHTAKSFTPCAWLVLNPDDTIHFILPRTEMGQGILTGLATLIAEELEVDPTSLTHHRAPPHAAYKNPIYNLQITGGSNSLSSSWEPLRQAAADAKQQLLLAGAKRWKVKPQSCRAHSGKIWHTPSNRYLSYGQLTTEASSISLDTPTPLKKPIDFRYIGQAISKLDSLDKITGKTRYGIDSAPQDSLKAVVVRSPNPGGVLKHFDASAIEDKPGIVKIMAIKSGVAVIAQTYWQANQAAKSLVVDWDTSRHPSLDTESIFSFYKNKSETDKGKSVTQIGNIEETRLNSHQHIEAEYLTPFLAHAAMEPGNCSAYVSNESCKVWAPTQAPDATLAVAASISGLPSDKIEVIPTAIGGSFGRRLAQDFVAEAVEIASKLQQAVQVIWSREDDIQHDFYRPASYSSVKASLDTSGNITAWQHKIVGPSILSYMAPSLTGAITPEWLPSWSKKIASRAVSALHRGTIVDESSVEGAADLIYKPLAQSTRYIHADAGIPVGFWRSVGHSQNAFVVESFVDELAHASKRDPYEYRIAQLAHAPRMRAVLHQVEHLSRWGKTKKKNVFQGLACHFSFGSYVAQVAEVSVDQQQVVVERIYCVIDCGMQVNPNIIKEQVSGAIIFGLTAALYGEITFQQGHVEQSNFHDYPVTRIDQTPRITIDIIQSQAAPSGAGEPATPPVAPAISNAIFAATGKRTRKLPLKMTV